MRKANKLLLTMGSAMLISSGAAVAGPPAQYNAWSVSGGAITPSVSSNGNDATGCPTGFTCGAAITGDGFFQRQVTAGDGTKYFQTIVTPTGATASGSGLSGLEFTDENFVKQGGGTGIADSQHISAAGTPSNPGDFASTTNINAGWAKTSASENLIDLNQSVTDAVNGFTLDFTLTDASTNNTAPVVGINESVSLGGTDKQEFYLTQLKASGAGTSTPTLPTGATGTGSISWAANDIIQAMWLGQAVTAGTGGTQGFNVQGYTNVTTGSTTSYSEQGPIPTGPFSWDSTFGTAPVF